MDPPHCRARNRRDRAGLTPDVASARRRATFQRGRGARRGVARVADAFQGSASNEAHANAIEGGPGLVGVFDALRQGAYAREVGEAKTVVEAIVFVSATLAVVQFHSDLGPDGISGPYITDAVFNANGWQVAHPSYCQLVIPAGEHC